MKKQKSEKPSQITLHYFALYPFSLSFQESQEGSFILYLEKCLQILARFPPADDFTPKDKKAFFEVPDKVNPFRIISEKSMVYQWSIYKSVVIQGQNNEEFIESEKIDLTNFWHDFQQKSQSIKEMEITFKKLKCKFSYLVTVGSLKQVQQRICKYLIPLNQVKQNKKEHQFPQQIGKKSIQSQQKSAIQQKIPNLMKEKLEQVYELMQSKTSFVKIEETSPQQTKQSFGNGLDLMRTNSYEMVSQQELKQEQKKEVILHVKDSQQTKTNNVSITDSQAYPPIKLHLSASEMEIQNEIEQRIKKSDEIVLQPLKLLAGMSLAEQSIHAQMMANYKKKKAKRITSSQKLNQKGQIIVTPFYYHPKYYLILAAIIFIFVGLVMLNPQSHLHESIEIKSKVKPLKGKKGSHKDEKKKKN